MFVNRILRAGGRVLSELHKFDGEVAEIDGELLAFGPSRLNDEEKKLIRRVVWTSAFLDALVPYLKNHRRNWKILYIALGNTTAFAVSDVIDRVLSCEPLLSLLHSHLILPQAAVTPPVPSDDATQTQLQIALAKLERENNESTISTWVVANLVQGTDGEISPHLHRFIPPLSRILVDFHYTQALSQSTSQTSLSEEALTSLFSVHQSEFRSFRALAGLFSIRLTRFTYPTEYQHFLQIITEDSMFIRSVLYEYSLGLEGRVIPGTQFFPDAYQRALTVSFLSTIPECREVLCDHNVIPLLTQSLWTRYLDSDMQTSLLWRRAITSLHHLAMSSRERRQHLRADVNIDGLVWIACWEESKGQLIGWKSRQVAAEVASLLHLKEFWEIERLLWITQRKKQSKTCFLATLPEALVKVVVKWLVLFSSSEGMVERVHGIYNGYNKSQRK